MAAIIALTPPLIPLICFMDLANFMFLSRSCTHKEEGQPHSSNTSRKSFARLFFPSCIIPNNISHKNSVQATDFLQCKQCLCNVTVFENWDFQTTLIAIHQQKSMGNMLKLKVCSVYCLSFRCITFSWIQLKSSMLSDMCTTFRWAVSYYRSHSLTWRSS